jgi:hypothetical protein
MSAITRTGWDVLDEARAMLRAAAALDAAIHARDIAVATGQGSPLTPELARLLTPVAKSIVEPLRQYGVYAAAVEPGPGAGDAAVLLGYLGRSPAWGGESEGAEGVG